MFGVPALWDMVTGPAGILRPPGPSATGAVRTAEEHGERERTRRDAWCADAVVSSADQRDPGLPAGPPGGPHHVGRVSFRPQVAVHVQARFDGGGDGERGHRSARFLPEVVTFEEPPRDPAG